MARTFKKTDLAIDNSEVREIVKELKHKAMNSPKIIPNQAELFGK